jgi:xanthine dehydrogenase YagS FAD-binding subunit
LSHIAAHDAIAREFPAITEALLESASPQIRNMATLGGNLMQRTRCVYFRNGDVEVACNKRKASTGCAALATGRPRDFAVLGATDKCIATHPSDVAVALAALDARVHLRGPGGDRTVPVADFIRLPAQAPERDTELAPGELIVAVEVPAANVARRSVYLKLRDRASYEFALVSVAAGVALENGRISAARLALGGIAHRPWRLTSAEQALRGITPDDARVAMIIENDLTSIPARAGNDVKLTLVSRLALRAIRAAAARKSHS